MVDSGTFNVDTGIYTVDTGIFTMDTGIYNIEKDPSEVPISDQVATLMTSIVDRIRDRLCKDSLLEEFLNIDFDTSEFDKKRDKDD